MNLIKKDEFTGWEVSIIKLKEDELDKYKVTRRFPELTVAETKIFFSKKEALAQFEEWLNNV
ncbi:MAG: hypothetical protein WC758_04760 [Candidatus Woesearchaeota archaeon]|jgi:hypothetical protein